MPLLHRWWGNPMFSWMVRRWFRAPIHDVHCGLRGFTRDLYEQLDQLTSDILVSFADTQEQADPLGHLRGLGVRHPESYHLRPRRETLVQQREHPRHHLIPAPDPVRHAVPKAYLVLAAGALL